MSLLNPPPTPSPFVALRESAVTWSDPQRETAFHTWLAGVATTYQLLSASLCTASADASFRRYLRITSASGTSFIIMDAPPGQENSEPFVRIAALMLEAGLNVPRVLAWDEACGFMLLSDLGAQTLMDVIDRERPQANQGLYLQAVDALLLWQRASRPGVLPPYDAALLQRELALFPDWYLTQHRGVAVQGPLRETLDKTFATIVAHNLAAPSVYVHRDFMPRNLMVASPALGVLDFQDAVYGPATYDIASLMRDAFLSWEEDFVLDITVRYWDKARRAGLLDFEDWHSDFGSFYRSVEWMGLQRHLKVAGIFARLTLRDGKPQYLADTPRFIGYIRATASRYRELTPLLRLIDRVEGTEAATGYAYGRV
ncbi:MAG: aminoglycoside phosphotransferase [Burkholderiaceae bacterium]|nr:MAG: aminoglycoside phosphotransferase [Burkholderiaceae bacterium]